MKWNWRNIDITRLGFGSLSLAALTIYKMYNDSDLIFNDSLQQNREVVFLAKLFQKHVIKN